MAKQDLLINTGDSFLDGIILFFLVILFLLLAFAFMVYTLMQSSGKPVKPTTSGRRSVWSEALKFPLHRKN
jgi:hypothetical protein